MGWTSHWCTSRCLSTCNNLVFPLEKPSCITHVTPLLSGGCACKGVCYFVLAANSFLILVEGWWLCQVAATEEKQEHCFFLFYMTWFCWSSDFTFQIVFFSAATKVYHTVMESILFITNKGQDGSVHTERYPGQSHLATIVTGYFIQTQFHRCFTWYLYLLSRILYSLFSTA